MRRADKEIASREDIDRIIFDCDVCRPAVSMSGEPYLVPVSFGCDGERLHFHIARTGRKIDCMTANNRVCFEMERNVSLVTDDQSPANGRSLSKASSGWAPCRTFSLRRTR